MYMYMFVCRPQQAHAVAEVVQLHDLCVCVCVRVRVCVCACARTHASLRV